MTANSWTDVSIVGRAVQKEIDERVEVEWKLSTKPDLEWAEAFQMVELPEREGSIEWVLGGGPNVIQDVVRWFVPASQIESADAEVRHRLFMANGRLRIDRLEQKQ